MQTANVNVPLKLTGRHVPVTDPIRDYVSRKIDGLHLDYPRIIEANVILEVEKYRHIAEVILVCTNHITIDASAETNDMYASIDEAMSKIAQQMRKYKTKIMRQHRPRKGEVQHFDEHVLSVEGLDTHEESEPNLVHTEKYSVKPMFVDEAVLQLEMSTRQFLVFLNAQTEKINVLYRRKSGDFGLIQPTVS